MSLAGCASLSQAERDRTALAPGDHYVAMGSSFAAGPGVTTTADQSASRCARSKDNYARQIARSLSLVLVDVSCSGATTAHVLGAWDELSPQIDALTPDTRLVTVTIGGNDVSFVRNMIAYVCQPRAAMAGGAPDPRCPTVHVPTETEWAAMEAGLNAITADVRRRSPDARLVFVQYVSLLPDEGSCPAVPISAEGQAVVRAIATRLARTTAHVAARWGATVIDPADDEAAHDPCSGDPWATGFPLADGPAFIPFHPNLAGMTAIARRAEQLLRP